MKMPSKETMSSESRTCGFNKALASAVLEWALMFMLYIHAIFSFLITQFARYFELQLPCLLCSRLDHLLGDEKPDFYRDLICGHHKSEISSLVFCHEHNKLTDVHNMCESCLFSFATINKSNAETYRLLVGKMGEDPEDRTSGSSSTKPCSCCNKPWISKGYTRTLLQSRSISSVAGEHDDMAGALSVDEHKMIRNNGSDPLYHFGYTELKITSDTESEVVVSDDEDHHANALVLGTTDPQEDIVDKCVQMQPHIVTLLNEFTSEKMIEAVSEHESSFFDSKLHSDGVTESHDVGTPAEPSLSMGHGLEELDWQQAEHKELLESITQITSLDDAPSESNEMETLVQDTKQISSAVESDNAGKICLPESESISKTKNEATKTVETDQETKSEASLQTPNLLELGDAYKIAVGNNRDRQLSGKQLSIRESTRVSEDLKILLSQISATRGGTEFSMLDMSPRVYGNNNEDFQVLQKRIFLERNESGFESLDGSLVNEIEGESALSQLKRQIEHDRKLLRSLYRELEEERSASTVAANQAMAMITRLQEEKAALHMEALQYLRMMEEQSEYDMEALQRSNDLLTERENEIQDLEAELENFKIQFSDKVMPEIDEIMGDTHIKDETVKESDTEKPVSVDSL